MEKRKIMEGNDTYLWPVVLHVDRILESFGSFYQPYQQLDPSSWYSELIWVAGSQNQYF